MLRRTPVPPAFEPAEDPPRTPGRLIGALLLVQLAGLILPFVLLHPLNAPEGFLVTAAPQEERIRLAVMLLLANAALTCGIAIALRPVLGAGTPQLASWLVVAGAVMVALQAVDNSLILGMVSLSRDYAAAQGSAPALYPVTALALRSTRVAAHYGVLLAIEAWMALFYLGIGAAALVPRWLAAFGALTTTLHIAGVTLQWFTGHPSIMPLAMPLAASHLAVAAWFLTKGFGNRSVSRASPA